MTLELSISKHITENYKSIEIDLYELETYTNRYNYSFGCFKDGYRKASNVISIAPVLCYDIDENLSIKECQNLLESWSYVIITSKSHQKDKHGLVCDRYRLILPLTKAPMIEDYSEFYDYVGDMLGIKHDKATKDVSRFYFPNKTQVSYINRTNRDTKLDTDLLRTMFLEHQKRELETAKQNLHSIKITVEGNIDALVRWFKENIHDGGRNNLLFRLRKALENENLNNKQIISLVEEVNYSMDNPLSEKELQKTVLRGIYD